MPLTSEDIKRFEHCQHLTLDDFTTLEALRDHATTEVLTLHHFYRIPCLDLSPISSLTNLRALTMATTLTWDGTNRHLLVETFAPLARLPRLEMLQILGVVPRRDRLTPLGNIKSLKKVSIGNTTFYQLEDFAKLSSALPSLAGTAPIFEMNFKTICKKCKVERLLYLNGARPRSRRYVCPRCNKSLLLKHIRRWNDSNGQPTYQDLDQMSPQAIWRLFGNPNAT